MGLFSNNFKKIDVLFLLIISSNIVLAQALSWDQLGDDIAGTENFGVNISFNDDGTIMAVGAPGGSSSPGYAAVYNYIDGNWLQMGDTVAGSADGDRFGRFTSLSADGTIMAIGAPQSGAGYVKVFEYNGSSWGQKGSKLTGDATGDEFGTCVSLSADGSRLAVGAFKFDSGVNTDDGQVKIYDYSSDWTETASIKEGVEGEYAGYSLSLSSDGKIVAIGAYNSDAGGTGRGITRIYREETGDWENIGSISGSADN